MKKITIYKEGNDSTAAFYNGSKKIGWDEMNKEEQEGLLEAMRDIYQVLETYTRTGKLPIEEPDSATTKAAE